MNLTINILFCQVILLLWRDKNVYFTSIDQKYLIYSMGIKMANSNLLVKISNLLPWIKNVQFTPLH